MQPKHVDKGRVQTRYVHSPRAGAICGNLCPSGRASRSKCTYRQRATVGTAVSFGLWAGGRFSAKELLPHIVSQCAGAIAAAGTLFFIWSGKTGNVIDNTKAGAFASNGFGAFSPDGYSMISCFAAEFVLTAFFLLIILGATDKFANGKFAGVAIGLGLTLIHLVSIPITNTSVNPARSLSQAIFTGGEPLNQVWLFWAAPIAGAIVGGFIYKMLLQKSDTE